MTTIREVAKRANVPVATVSRTLNNPGSVSEELATRVMQAVQELNYTPSVQARSLVLGVTSFVGLIVSDITNPFFPELVRVLRKRVRNAITRFW